MKTLTTLAVIGVLAILGAIAAAVFFFGGFYNVAASEEDPAIVNWALVHIRRASITRHAAAVARRCRGGAGRSARLLGARLRQLSRRAGRELGQILRGLASRSARSQGARRPAQTARFVLGRQARHPHDRYAELRSRRGAGPGNLDDRRLSQEAPERIGGGLQGVVRETLRASRAAAYF